MARQPNDDVNEERSGQSESDKERLRGVAPDEEEFEEGDESDEEDEDEGDESTF